MICHWASTQATVALSSAEAELNALVKAGCETLFVMNILEAMGRERSGELMTDSSAAHGIAHREGAGKVKHLEARQLWVQELIASKTMKIHKIPRELNPADALTHHWLGHEGLKHHGKIGLSDFGLSSEPACLSVVYTSSPAPRPRAVNPRGGVKHPSVLHV